MNYNFSFCNSYNFSKIINRFFVKENPELIF